MIFGAYTMDEYLLDLVGDARIAITDFYDHNDSAAMPIPYANIADFYELKRTYNVRFPSRVDNIDRPTQYYMLSRFLTQLQKSRIGVVAILKIDIPARPEIPEKWWNLSCPAMLIGVTSSFDLREKQDYIVRIVLFNHFDNELEFFEIEDMRIWEDFVDNTNIFRDFLIFGQNTMDSGTYDIATMYLMLQDIGFVFDFEEEAKKQFFGAQDNFFLPPKVNCLTL
jgi:hypothetical protein